MWHSALLQLLVSLLWVLHKAQTTSTADLSAANLVVATDIGGDISDGSATAGNVDNSVSTSQEYCWKLDEEDTLGVHNDRRRFACVGLTSAASLAALLPSTVLQLTINSSILNDLHSDHLVHMHHLRTLELYNCAVTLRGQPWQSTLPLQRLLFHSCWSVVPHSPDPAHTPLTEPSLTPYLLLTPSIWSRVSSLQRLELIDNNITVEGVWHMGLHLHDGRGGGYPQSPQVETQPGEEEEVEGFSLLPRGCFLYIEGGNFECQASHVYLLSLMSAGRASITNSTLCFILADTKFNPLYTFNWKSLLHVLSTRLLSREQCPRVCRCSLVGFRKEDPLLSVDCSNTGLTVLPHTIPPFATSLNMHGNRLTSLDTLFRNPNYHNLGTCDFSNNNISSVNATAMVEYIERTRNNDVNLNLRGNKFTTFPVLEMSGLYIKLRLNGVRFLPVLDLSGNPWNCDNCSFSPHFKSFIYDNMFNIRDHAEVRCASSSVHNPDVRILHADFGLQCDPPPQSFLLPIDLLNIFMGCVLALLLADFIYNYYQYHRHGKLPWLVRTFQIC